MAKDITKVTTKSGFECELSKERLNNYELLEAIGEFEENPLVMTKVVTLLLGKDEAKRLKDHVRTENGIVPADRMDAEITEIFQSQNEIKNS